MKVLFCAHDRPNYINGPNIWLKRLLPELRDEGIDCRILFFPSGNPAECLTLNSLQDEGFICEIYQGERYTQHRVQWILKKTEEHSPDIFVPNLIIPAYYASKWIKESGIPTVGVLHSNDPFYSAIIEDFLQKPDPSPLSAIVAVSEFLEAQCRECCSNKIRIFRIPYGVPVPEKTANGSDNTMKFIYAGRLVERQKRISDVVHVLCRMTREIPGTEAILYGSGHAQKNVENIIKEYGPGTSVRLGGLIENHELQNRLLEGHVFVLLSDFEGLPIALMEAMACGLVPVCYNMKSGIPELVQDGKNGLLVNDREDEFIKAVLRLRNEAELWKTMSVAARKKIESGYSIKISGKKWLDLFKELYKQKTGMKSISIPKRLDLPERNPKIRKMEDLRYPGFYQYYFQQGKNMLKKAMKKIA